MSTYISPRTSRTAVGGHHLNFRIARQAQIAAAMQASNVSPRASNRRRHALRRRSSPPFCATVGRSSMTPVSSVRSTRRTVRGRPPRSIQIARPPINASTAPAATAPRGIQSRRGGPPTCARHSASVARRMRSSASGERAGTCRLLRNTSSSSDFRGSCPHSATGGDAAPAIRHERPVAPGPIAIPRRFPRPAAPCDLRGREFVPEPELEYPRVV